MSTNKNKRPEQLDLVGGTLKWEYASAFNIMAITYKVNGHEYAVHFEQGGLTYYIDGTRKWHITGS